MTTKAFTLIEILVVAAIIAIGVLIITHAMASSKLKHGMHVTVKASKVKAVLVSNEGCRWVCRIDNGPGSNPRYSEVRFFQDEIEELVEAEKAAP